MKYKNIKLSVIVPYYNMGKYIDSLLESLDRQTYKEFEIIIVNDGSNDVDSLEKLNEIEKYRPEIKIINQKNKGLPAARNAGIKESKGMYICCIDSDDKYQESFLKKAVDYLDSHKDVHIISSWVRTFGESIKILKLCDAEFPNMLFENNIHVASIYRKKLWDVVGGYDENMKNGYEDWEFWINCLAHKAKVHTFQEILFYYRVTKGSMLNALRSDAIKVQDNLIYIYKKHESAYKKYLIDVLKGKDKDTQYKNIVIEDLREKIVDLKTKELSSSTINSTMQELITRNTELIMYNHYVLSRIDRLLEITKRISIKLKLFDFVRSFKSFISKSNRFYKVENQQTIYNTDPVFSVIIPNHNYGNFLNNAIESIQGQTWKRAEIIIVDDASPDEKTIQILKEIEQSDYLIPIRVIKNTDNKGVVYTRNIGIEAAKGKYIVCLDADDKIDKTYLEKCIWVFETHPEVGVVYSDLQMFGMDNTYYAAGVFNPNNFKIHNQIYTAAAFRKKCWEEVGGYKEEMKKGHEDWEYWLSISELGWEGYRIAEPLFHYRKHSKSSLSEKALQIDNILKIKIKKLHTALYREENYRPSINRNKKRTSFQEELFNQDVNIAIQEKVIALFVPSIGGGGAERFWMNYIQELKSYGYKFIIFGTLDASNYVYKGIKEAIIAYFSLPVFLEEKYWMNFIKNQIKKYNIQTAIVSNSKFAYVNASKLKGINNLTIIDIIYNDSEHGCLEESLDYDNLIDLHLVNNPLIKKHYVEYFDIPIKKVEYLPTPIDLEFFNPGLFDRNKSRGKYNISDDEFVLSYIGRFSSLKNIDKLVKAFANLLKDPNTVQQYKLMLVGQGEQRQEIEILINGLGLGDRVIIMDFVDDPRDIYIVSDLYVQISQVEGMPPGILEALAMNVSILATDGGAKMEILKVDKNSYILESLDESDITQKIKSIAENNYLYGSNLRKFVKEYDKRLLAKKFQNILEDY